MNLRKGSIIIGSKSAITPKEYLDHVDAVRTAWRYAAAQTIHDIRLAKRLKKQKKFGHFSIEQWGRTSRVFEKFFWFHSHHFIQYFLQGAVFCTAIYFAAIVQFGQEFLFTKYNFEHKLPQIILLFGSLGAVIFLGLFRLVPAILMQYTMVMHLAQLQTIEQVREAVDSAKLDAAEKERKREESMRKRRRPWCRLSCDDFDAVINSNTVLYFFLTLLIADFFITVLASVVRQDQHTYCVERCLLPCLREKDLPSAAVQKLQYCLLNKTGLANTTVLEASYDTLVANRYTSYNKYYAVDQMCAPTAATPCAVV